MLKTSSVTKKIETTLLSSPKVFDCRVFTRVSQTCESDILAYVVPHSSFSANQLRKWLSSMLDDEQLPKFFIPLSTLPLTSSGDCDLEILLQIPVMDEELIKDFEKQFDELPGVKKAAALIRHDPKFDRLIHLSDLLPNWSVSGHLDALEASDCKAISPDVETPKEKPLAISDGGFLILAKDAPTVLMDTLSRAVEIAGNTDITYYFVDNREEKSTYAGLMDSARSIFAGLKTSGLKSGTPVIFQFENNRDFLESFWACILGGFVPVPLAVAPTYRELNSAVKRLGDVWHMFGQPPVLTSADMVPEIKVAARLLESSAMTILDISKLQRESPDTNYHKSKPEDIALIMLTSGSTGAPKGVPLTHRNLVSRSIASQQMNGFDQNTVSLNWMPLDHVASIIYFHLRDVYLGCEQIHAATERILQEPLLWLDLIERYRATVTFGPNFAFGLVCGLRNEIAKRKWDLSSMRLVLNGGEAVVAKTARQFLTILEPHGLSQDAMCPAWGMSEISSGITYAHKFQLSSTSDEDRYVQVGPPIPGNKFRIVDNNEVIKEGEIGSLQVKGITVFKGYYKSQELSKEAFTIDGWFKTGDLGKLDNGSLTITGREKDIIIINGVNYAGPGIEAVVEDIEGVIRSNTAACAVPDPGKNRGEALAIFFCPESQSNDALKELLKEIRNQVVKNIGISPEFLVPLSPVDIPKTSIGKIQRSKLQKAFAEDRFREELKRTDVLSANSNTIPAWFFSRGWQKKSRTPGRSLTKNDCVLIFGERTDITQTLERLLFSRGTKHIFIEQSKNFCRLSDKRYSLRPDNEEDYKKLFNSLATEGHKNIFAIYLWNFSYERCFDFNESFYQQVLKSCLGLTSLLQGFLNADKESNAFTLAIVTNNAQKVLSGDDVDCSKASLLGLGKAIPQENSDLKYLHIDMDVTGRDEDAEKIIAELESERLDRDIAYRKGHRMIPLLKQTEFLLSKETKSALQKGGCYLLSGGLGGIGRNIANYLLQEFRAHVIIIGRSPIFRGGQNKEESGYHDSDKLSEYHRLKSLPGEVAYLEADIGNRAELKKKIDDILSGWNKPLDGIFHLAGTYHERNVADETEDTLNNILYPKVMGAIALASLIEDHPDAFMVAFSSVTSIFSGATVGGYTAANQFLDAFFQQNMDNGRRFTVLNWATWQNTGMSLQYGATEPLRAMGIMDLPVEQALQSLRVALHQPPGQLIIGLDASKPYIQRHLSSLIPLEQIDVYYQQEDEVQKNSLLTLSLRDRYETSCDYRLNRISSVPLKDDGEVDHSKLLKIVSKGQLSKSRASTDTEKILTGIWQQILKVDDIDIDESFFELGGQSLMATQLIGSISDCFSIDLTLRDIFENPSIAQQGKIVDSIASKCSRTTSTDIQIISRTQVLPLSSPQKRMWFIDRLIPMNPVFNNSFTINFSKPVDILALENSLNQVIRRHETLRTVFPSVEGVPRQKILSELKATLPVIDLRSLSAEKRRQEVSRLINEEGRKPFDLKKGPLMRANLFILNESEYIFLVTIHHIITDGWSMAVFFEEVLRIYKAFQEGVKATLAELPVQYVDYSHWLSSSIQENVFESQLGYWKEQLKGITTGLELSTDQPRPDVQTFRGNHMIVTIPLELSDKIKQLCQKNNVTLFMWLLASYKVFLCQYTEQTDVVIGTVTANRNRPEVKNLIGLFINVVVLRTNLSGNPTFLDCLQKVKKVTLDAYENQDLPFEMLIEELQPQRDLSRAPLFQLAFDLRNENVTRSISEDINFVEHYTGTAKYDLHLTIEDEGNTNELACIWEYATDIFNDSTISKIAGNFLTLLKNITLNPEMFIDELLFLSSSEHRHILEDWNDNSKEEWLDNKCVHQLVEEQVDLNPMAIAVMYNNNMLTYGVLEKKANQLSRYLKSIDVGPETLVGILIKPSLEMIIGILGVLKAGGAYVPLDPSYPKERLAFMVSDTNIKALLTGENFVEHLPINTFRTVFLDKMWPEIAKMSSERLSNTAGSHNLAYVMYTSGSTGRPKGVLLEHYGLCNLVRSQIDAFKISHKSRVIQFATFGFDASVSEIFTTLASGARLCLGNRDELMPGNELMHFLKEKEITHATIPPSVLRVLPDTDLPLLKTIVSAGESCSLDLVHRWASGRRFLNAYGPTETTVCATIGECSINDKRDPGIGRPMANVKIYLLDESMQPVPAGKVGELFIGGAGIARGYLNREELNTERFLNIKLNGDQNIRLYRTGDLARYRTDKTIEYLGRKDQQIKLRGFRIEPGEIEYTLRSHSGIRDAVVISREDKSGSQRIAAYIVPESLDKKQEFQEDQKIELWPSVAEFFVYDEMIYYAMTNDEHRNNCYKKAINRLVKGKVALDIGTGRDAILARFCVEGGAKKIYAIELLEDSYRSAKDTIEKLGLQEKIILIHGNSTKVELPERVDVCVSEIVGAIGGSEGAAALINNAHRFLKENGVMIPARSKTLIAGVTLPEEFIENPLFSELSGTYTQKIFEQVGYMFDLRLSLRNLKKEDLSTTTDIFEDLNFNRSNELESTHDIELKVTNDRKLNGFIVWLTLQTIDDVWLDILGHEHCWLPVFMPIFNPAISVSQGDIIKATINRTVCDNGLNPDYHLKGTVIRTNKEKIEFDFTSYHNKKIFRNNPFYRKLFSDDSMEIAVNYDSGLSPRSIKNFLGKYLPDYMIPSDIIKLNAFPLTSNGKINRKALPSPDQITGENELTLHKNDLEHTISRIWQVVLDVDQVGINKNFFDLGGHSLKMAQVQSALSTALKINVKLVDLFQYPTVSSLAKYLYRNEKLTNNKQNYDEDNKNIKLSGRIKLAELAKRQRTERERES